MTHEQVNLISTDCHLDDKPSLCMNERIVWISDNGPEYGNVRWLGKLADLGKEWMAGVEFDNPVGSGTGLYRDQQLFVTRMNHASLVPVIGLLKACDFEIPAEPERTTPPPRLIDFYSEPTRRHEHEDFDNFYSKFHERVEDLSRARILDTRLGNRSAESRVRQIPVTLESDFDRIGGAAAELGGQARSELARNMKPAAAAQSSEHARRDQIHDLTSSFKQTSLHNQSSSSAQQQQQTSVIPLLPAPALIVPPGEENPGTVLKNIIGKPRGIQGHNNSCYLDATLFSMFSSTTLFDSLLYRPAKANDIPEYARIQEVLRDEIVQRLREHYLVSADTMMILRKMLEHSSSVEGLTDEEKDPEEFLSLLLGQILKAEPYLKLSSGLESFFYQLIVDKDESVVLPTVQDLFDQSFIGSTVRLREIPPCLLLQMPRFGRQYKMYSRIMPSLSLDITDVLQFAPRSCGHKGKDCDNIARFECKDCLSELSGRGGAKLSSVTYCNSCFQSKHFSKSHMTGIEGHSRTKSLLELTPNEALQRYSNKISHAKDKSIPRIQMELFAVLCIETSHYVSFVKCGNGPRSPWCFFDSMADRTGELKGHSLPEILLFEEFSYWTSEDGISYLLNHKEDKLLPEMARRLICDAYLCFYRYEGLSSYR